MADEIKENDTNLTGDIKNTSDFDKQLEDLKNGNLPDSHVFNLGKPSIVLQNCGFPPNDRIELAASRLRLKAGQGNHLFDIMDITGLDKALHTPVAVFEYGDMAKSQNIIVNLKKDDKNFLVGVFFNQHQRGYEVSDIRGLFNRDNIDWLRWIQQGKMIYGNKGEIQVLAAQQRTNLAEVNSKEARTSSDSYYLDSVDNILHKFGDVKDIYTIDFPEYKEQKERFNIFKQFRTAYLENDSINVYDAVREADEFYDALKANNKSILEKYTDGIEKPELSNAATDILNKANLEKSSQFKEVDLSYYYDRFKKETANRNEEVRLQKAIELALEKETVQLQEVKLNRENWNKLFPTGTVETPIGTVKLGENQFEKLQKNDRNNLLAAMYETLSNPAIILEKETLDEKTGEFRPVNVYGKSFIREDSNHKRAIESVVIFKDGENISISTHNKNIKDFVKQIKTADQIIFADSEISRVTSLILQNGGSQVQLKGINTQALNTRYDKNNLLSIKDLQFSNADDNSQIENISEAQVLAAQQRTNLADVNSKEARTSSDSYYLDSSDNVLQSFTDVKDVFDLSYYYDKFMKEAANETEDIQLQKALAFSLDKNVSPLIEVKINRENWSKLFPTGTIETPIGTVKLGENQFEKLQKNDRNNLLAAMYETLSNPAIILEKETLDEKTGEFRPVNVYGKSFIREDSNHKRAIESVVIFKDGENISISTHNKNIKDFVKQIKTADQIIFADSEISRVTSLILQNGGSHVRLQDAISNRVINSRYDKNNLLSIKDLQFSNADIKKENEQEYMPEYNFNEYIHSSDFIEKFGDWEKVNRLEKNKLEADNPINRQDRFEQNEALNPLISQESLDLYDKRLINISQVPQMPYMERNPSTGKWLPTQEAVELVQSGLLYIEKQGQEYMMIDSRQKISQNNEINTSQEMHDTMYHTNSWDSDFPSVFSNALYKELKRDDNLENLRLKAKAGDRDAADELVHEIADYEMIRNLKETFPDAIVAPVIAEEASGNNQVPYAYANLLRENGFEIDTNIIQSVRSHHTGANSIKRFTNRVRFDGEVQKGKSYILVDDHIDYGGTLRDFKDYIEANGGKVLAFSTLTAIDKDIKICPTKENIEKLNNYGDKVDELLKQFGITDNKNGLTNGEVEGLLNLLSDKNRNREFESEDQRRFCILCKEIADAYQSKIKQEERTKPVLNRFLKLTSNLTIEEQKNLSDKINKISEAIKSENHDVIRLVQSFNKPEYSKKSPNFSQDILNADIKNLLPQNSSFNQE